jgi:hypothetical protein
MAWSAPGAASDAPSPRSPRRRRRRRSSPDHDEEPVLAVAGDDLVSLRDEVIQRVAARARIEQLACERLRLRRRRRHAAHEPQPGLGEPPQDLADRVPGFVQVAVLAGEPRLALARRARAYFPLRDFLISERTESCSS